MSQGDQREWRSHQSGRQTTRLLILGNTLRVTGGGGWGDRVPGWWACRRAWDGMSTGCDTLINHWTWHRKLRMCCMLANWIWIIMKKKTKGMRKVDEGTMNSAVSYHHSISKYFLSVYFVPHLVTGVWVDSRKQGWDRRSSYENWNITEKVLGAKRAY